MLAAEDNQGEQRKSTMNGVETSVVAENASFDADEVLRHALESNGQRFTEQRAAVYRYLLATVAHPTADDVFTTVRADIPDISLATVYKSLETLVGCGL